MKKTFTILSLAALILSFTVAETTWTLEKSHAKLGFSIEHLMISDVEGQFKKFDATIKSTKADFSDAVVELTADVNSINTDNDGRDEHLKKPDFFDAAKYPTISFTSTSFVKGKGNTYTVKGNLTMHGVSKPVTLTARGVTTVHPWNKKTIAGFKISGKVNRMDFGIGTETPKAILGEYVTITANAEFEKN